MQNWSCMPLWGHSSVEKFWSCDARARDSFSLLQPTQCFRNMLFYQIVHSCESILGVRENFHIINPLGVYTFFQKLVMMFVMFFFLLIMLFGNHKWQVSQRGQMMEQHNRILGVNWWLMQGRAETQGYVSTLVIISQVKFVFYCFNFF